MGFAYLNIHPVSTDINIRGNVFFEEGQLQEKYKPEDVQAEALPLSSYNEQNVIIIQSGFRRMKARKEAEQQKEQLEYTKPKNENIQPYRNQRLLAYGDDNYNKIADEKSRLLTPYVQYQLISAIRRQRKLIYSDGSIYEGYFSQDYQHSYGRLIMHLEIFKFIMMLSPQQGDFQNGKRTNKYADVKG